MHFLIIQGAQVWSGLEDENCKAGSWHNHGMQMAMAEFVLVEHYPEDQGRCYGGSRAHAAPRSGRFLELLEDCAEPSMCR